MMIFSLRRKRS